MVYYIPLPKNGVYTESQLNQIAEAMADDAQLQLKQDDSGIGWYDLKTRSAIELMSRIHPELSNSNSEAHLKFTLMVALISQNNSVGINFRQANEAYTYYKNNNKLPDKEYAGKSGNIIKENIKLTFKDIEKNGWDAFKNTLQESKTVKEWVAEGYKVNGENKTTEITGAMAILGSKIGSFWGNLNGDFTTLTADLWFSRMFNRYTGNVVANKSTEKSKQTTLDELKKYKSKTLLNGYKKSDILKGGEVFNKWLNTITKNYANGGYKDKQDLNVVSNTHFKNLAGSLQDIPRGGRERNAMRDVVKRVQDKLIERGYPKLDIADIQAIVWYNEKDLYRQYKAVNKSSEKTDYETAAQEVLKKQGLNAEVALPFQRGKSSTDGGGIQTDTTQSKGVSSKVKPPETRQQIVGENAELPQNVRDNLSVARQMENDFYKTGFKSLTPKESAKMIRIATGWERGVDGKWRYEIQDGKLTLKDSGTFKLSNIYDSKDLYIAYPQLKDMKVKVDIREQGANNAWFIPSDKSIEINAKPDSNIASDLVHEIQHAIQFIEIFATGGNTESAFEAYENTVTPEERKAETELKEEVKVLDSLGTALEMAMDDYFEGVSLDELLDLDFMQKNWEELAFEEVDDAVNVYNYVNVDNPEIINKLKIDEAYGYSLELEESMEVARSIYNKKRAEYGDKYSTYALYQRLGGEVESRNVEKRLFMTEKKRRENLLEETEDRAREDQILLFPDAPETRKQIVGENAELSQNVRDNLSVARQMETDNKDAKTIRIATGWERGVDGKWRYEIDDVKIKDNFNFTDLKRIPSGMFMGRLSEVIKNKKLFDLYPDKVTKYVDIFDEDDGSLLPFKRNDNYPSLADVKVYFDDKTRYGTYADYDPIFKNITIYRQPGNATREQMSVSLLHEIQHYIQGREGFAIGGNLEISNNPMNEVSFGLVNGLRTFAKSVAIKNPEKGFNITDDSDAAKRYEKTFGEKPSSIVINLAAKLEQELSRGLDINETTVYKTLKNNDLSPYEKYERLAGEVESRNVEQRMNMTPEQRRETTLQETEDVAREDQIFFTEEQETRQQKATPLTDELIGLNESEIIKQGYLEFFSSMKDKAEDADFIYSEFVEEALDRMQSKINRIRETFKNKISRNKEARKEVRKQIAEILKNSGLDSISKRAIKSIMKNIENATPATMQKKVAEVMDVISRDIKRQARYNRKKTLGKALKNIGKIGSLKELNNILVDALKINPQYLSDKTLVKYDKIISSLSSVNKKFNMPSRVELKALAEAVITSFQADYKLAQEIIKDRINNNLDPNKSVLENLNQMKKENKITDSEYELLVRFKDQINETKKENVSAEDKAKTAQERRGEATEDFEAVIQGIPKSFKDLNDDERSVLRIVKTLTLKDLENLSTNEIQKLVRGLEGLMAGYVGSDLIQSVDTIKADRLSKNTATGETLERGFIDKLLTRAKTTIMNIFRARDKQVTPIMERIRSTPLKNIDQILNDAAKGFKSTKIYENVFRPTGVAFEAASKKLKMAKKDLDRAGAFLDIGRNKRYAQKVKIMIYQIQREYDSNGGKKANAELVTAISMINHTLKDPLVDLSDRERAAIEKIRDEYLSIDGEIDADKIFNSFTDKEKKSLALIDKVYSDIQEMARMDAARQGLPFVLRKNYVHLPRITKGQNTMTSEEEFEALADNFANPVSMKSKALFQRNGKPHSISFDPIYNANAISRKATVSYYMVPAVKIGKRVLANLKANAKTDYQKDLFNSLEEVYDSIIRSEYKNVTKDRAFIEKALSFLGRSGYLAQLAGPIKAAVELASNATHAILYNPIAFNEGFQVLSKVPKDTINKALNNVYSTQTARLTTNEGGGKDIDERLYASAPLFQQEQMTSDFGDRIGKVFSVLKKPAKAFMKFNEDLITKPDYLVAKPLFVGAFSASFEESTGQKPNWEKIANDENYRNKFDSAIQKASEDGDAAVIDNAASNNPFDAIPKNILDRDASAIKQALQTVNRYMSRFRTFEYYSALKGVQSMIGKGDLTKSQGALLLTATVIRMSMYKMAIDMAFSVIFSLLGLDDEDDEKEIDEEVSKGVLGAIATLALGRYLGNVAQMPVNYGTEWLNREYGEGITFSGDYNAYKDGIVFSKIPMEVRPQDNMISNVVINSLGSYTPMVKTVDRAGKLITRATASKRQETRDRNLDELLTRIPFEIAGNSGVIPGYKTLRKIYNKYLFGAGKNAATSKPNKISRFTGPKLNSTKRKVKSRFTGPKLNK